MVIWGERTQKNNAQIFDSSRMTPTHCSSQPDKVNHLGLRREQVPLSWRSHKTSRLGVTHCFTQPDMVNPFGLRPG